MTKCLNCTHHHSDIDGVCLTRPGECECTPESFNPVMPSDETYRNLAFHQKILSNIQDVHQRVEWMLKAVDGTRNMSDWEFITTCWHYFIGFKFGSFWDEDIFNKIKTECQPETIRRARQKVCHPELEQLRLFQEELKELEKKGLDGRPEYWQLTERIKQFWNESKYIPNDFAMLKKKQIKESAIFEYSIQELNDICSSVKQRIAQ